MIDSFRLILAQYFDDIIHKIDIDSETQLLENSMSDFHTEINSIRAQYITKISSIKENNLSVYDSIKIRLDTTSAQEVFYKNCKEFCFLIDHRTFHECFEFTNKIGLLVLTDYFLTIDQIDKIK